METFSNTAPNINEECCQKSQIETSTSQSYIQNIDMPIISFRLCNFAAPCLSFHSKQHENEQVLAKKRLFTQDDYPL